MKRRLAVSGVCMAPWLLAACASNPVATRWYELRGEPPGPKPAPRPGDGALWEVSGAVTLPGALDRDTLMVSSGAAGLQALAGHRWAEPLRDSIPRLLVADLAVLRGEGLVWRAPVPAGVAVARRLRVEIITLVADRRPHQRRGPHAGRGRLQRRAGQPIRRRPGRRAPAGAVAAGDADGVSLRRGCTVVRMLHRPALPTRSIKMRMHCRSAIPVARYGRYAMLEIPLASPAGGAG
jgi:uncharacterized lipoprotein YmbA